MNLKEIARLKELSGIKENFNDPSDKRGQAPFGGPVAAILPPRNNGILKLQNELEHLKKEKAEIMDTINHLKSYLLSSKFHHDTTVQVKDVLARLPDIYPD